VTLFVKIVNLTGKKTNNENHSVRESPLYINVTTQFKEMKTISVIDGYDGKKTWKSTYISFVEQKWLQSKILWVTKQKSDIYYCTVENDEF